MKSLKALVPTAAATAALAMTLAACGASGGDADPTGASSSDAGDTRGGTLTLGILQEPASWDPAQAHVGHRLQPFQAAYDTLILREPDGSLAPMLATDWQYTDETNTVLELNLRTDVTFSDGAAFDADAVVANIEHFKQDNGPQAGMATAIESASAVDADTVEITLTAPDPALEYYLSQALGLMGSPEALGTDGIDRMPVGTGPYTMVADRSVVGSQYVFVPREDYWNPELQKWDEIALKLLADVTSRVNALVSGEVDAATLDATTFQQAESAGRTVMHYSTDWMGLLLFDRDGTLNPALADVRVRQAINYAMDRDNLLLQLGGGQGDTTSQVFGPDSTAYIAELDDYYTYDTEKAKALLAEAGYATGLTISMPLPTPGLETFMTFVTQQLGEVGITVELTQVPIADYQGELGKGNYPAAWMSLFQGPTWVAYQQLLSDTTLYNPLDSTSPEIEAAIEALRTDGENVEAAQALNTYVTENAWFVPWMRPSQFYAYNPDAVAVTPQAQMAVPSIYNYAPAS